MPSRSYLEVSDALESETEIDDQLVAHGLNRAVLAIKEHLKAWVPKRCEQGEEAGVLVLWRGQFEVVLVELAAVDDVGCTRQDVNGSVGRERVFLEP